MKKLLLILSLLTLLAIIGKQRSTITDLTTKLEYQRSYGATLVENNELAQQLLQTRTWYVVDSKTLSSLPNRGGDKVHLHQDEIRARMTSDRMGITHPDYNQAVTFSRANEGNGYTVAGKQLTYEYLN